MPLSNHPSFILDTPEPTRSAEAQRRYRERQRNGDVVSHGDVPRELIDMFIEAGWLGEGEISNPRTVHATLIDLADCYLRKTLDPPFPEQD